jgi:hypothetical protein
MNRGRGGMRGGGAAARGSLAALVLLAGPVALRAQQSVAVPDAPAFVFLNTSPTKISRPGTARELAVALANGLDSSGKAQQGLALDVIPWHLIPGVRITLQDYQRDPFKYALANTQLSFGTVRASGDTSSTDVALGFRVLVYDGSDAMRSDSLTSALRHKQLDCQNPPGQTELVPDDVLLQCIERVNKAARDTWFAKHWNESSFSFAVATGTRLLQSRVSDGRWLGLSAWAAGALRLWAAGQLTYQLRYDDRPAMAPTDAHNRSVSFGGHLAVGGPSVNGFLEVIGAERLSPASGQDRATASWSGGIEFAAASDLWLSTGFGSRFTGTAAKVVLIANIRWNVASGPRFSPAPAR